MKLIKEVEPIEGSGTTIITRENLRDFIEEPLVEVIEYLYDKNILTYMSSANKKNINTDAYLSMYYDKLSEDNKRIVQSKIKEGITGYKLVEDSIWGMLVRVTMPITEATTVDDVKKFFMDSVADFKMQDLVCEKYKSKTEILEAYFKYVEGMWPSILRDIHEYLEENPELEDEINPRIFIGDEEYDYESALKRLVEELGFTYCEEESTLYKSEEDLRRHKLFLETQIVPKEKENAIFGNTTETMDNEEIKNVYAENCPADAIREYIEKIINAQKKYLDEGREIPEELLIPQEIVLSPKNMEFLINSKFVDYIGAGETGEEIQFYWKKTEELPALELRAERREDGKFILAYIREEATEEKQEFIWDKKTAEGKKGTIVVSKTQDALEDIYDMDR